MDSEEMELDVVAIRCDWTEYTADLLIYEYGHVLRDEDLADEELSQEDKLSIILQYLKDKSSVIEVEQYSEPNTYLEADF